MFIEEMSVFRNKGVCSNPLGICGDQGVSFFETHCFVFEAQFKWDKKVLINGGKDVDELYELLEILRG